MTLELPSLTWLAALALGLQALAWGATGVLLRESRGAVAQWTASLLLLAVAVALVALRGEPRQWVHFNLANILMVLAFAGVRRGTEQFMGLPRRDAEQLAVLTPVLVLIALAGPGEASAALRHVAQGGAQAFVLLRMLVSIRPAVLTEFGRATVAALVIPSTVVVVGLLMLAGHHLRQWPRVPEIAAPDAFHFGWTAGALGVSAIFSFMFAVLLTQRLAARLRQASVRDPLTGLFNRRAMAEALEREWLRHRRGQQPLAVLVIDIDDFKRINETLGQAAGDSVLMHLASLLQRHVRAEDIVGRIGGEEFELVLPDTQTAQARVLAERLRALVRAEAVGSTISVGIAMAHGGDDASETLLARANAALYRAKSAGPANIEVDG